MSEPISHFARSYASIVQLVLSRVREFYREPEAIFWTYGFPLLMATSLGIAFRERPVETMSIDIVRGDVTAALADSLAEDSQFVVAVNDEATCRARLRTGKTSVVIRPREADEPDDSTGYDYWYDVHRPESILARDRVDDAVQRLAGRKDLVPVTNTAFDEPGGRYIDFLVPGLLGMSLMGGGLWGVGFVIVDMRMRKLLKRLLATPMNRSEFLAAIMISRLAFLCPEVLTLLVFARYAFGVVNHGSLLAVFALLFVGALAFSGLGLLVASRAKTMEAVSGLMNLVMVPMWVMSGIFFSSERFPEAIQPFVKILPLTMVIDALRAIMLDGLPLSSQGTPLLGLAAWGGISFVLALKWFRWQ